MNYLKFFYTTAIAIMILFVSGCSSVKVQPLSFYPENLSSANTKIDANLRSLTVSAAGPNEATGDIDFGIGTRETWRDSLQKALDVTAIFNDDSNRNISLTVTVLKFDAPSSGISMTTDVDARYEIIDRKNGDILFNKRIKNSSTVPGTYAFVGFQRARESVNRAVKANIQQFVDSLISANF